MMATEAEGLQPAAAVTPDAATAQAEAEPAAPPLLAGNRLSLDLQPGGCRRLLRLCAQPAPELRQAAFLRLSPHEDPRLLEAALALVPTHLPRLRSLVLTGELACLLPWTCLPRGTAELTQRARGSAARHCPVPAAAQMGGLLGGAGGWGAGAEGHDPCPSPGGQRRDPLGACLPGALTTLPAALGGLARLAHLDLSFNSLRTLPACVPHMRGLDALLVSYNHLSELPEALGALTALTFLSAAHNQLQALPTTLGALTSLQRLDLSGNMLDALPPAISGLCSLSELNLASNALQTIPASLGEWRQSPGPAGSTPWPLWTTGCSCQPVPTALRPSTAGLRSLRVLTLHSNRLTSVPASLAGLPLLVQLDLRDNQLRDVPVELRDAPFVRLKGNPLGEAPPGLPSPPGRPTARAGDGWAPRPGTNPNTDQLLLQGGPWSRECPGCS